MKWIENFDLFLFDFDGLLVNTEPLHYEAFKEMLKNKGFDLDWNYFEYSKEAHVGGDNLKRSTYEKFPALFDKEPSWEALRAEKGELYLKLLAMGQFNLMPGVEELLQLIKDKKSVIVTNSTKEQVDFIRAKLPILKMIDHVVSREQYLNPKPSPECYLRAIELYGNKGDKIIGFEDTIKGFKALNQTPLVPVLICVPNHPQLENLLGEQFFHYESFLDIEENFK